jgi:hypothetical protein
MRYRVGMHLEQDLEGKPDLRVGRTRPLSLALTVSLILSALGSACGGSASGGFDGGDETPAPTDSGDAAIDTRADHHDAGGDVGDSATDGAGDATSENPADGPSDSPGPDTTLTYSVGGTVYGLSGSLVLQDNGADNLTLAASAPYAFTKSLASGATYAVTILTQPASQTCTLMNPSGKITSADVTNVYVNCMNPTFTVGGNVSGLTGTGLVLQDNGGDDLPVSSTGPFTFAKGLLDGSSYDVTVLAQPTGQYCTVTSGSGTVAGGDVTTVSVSCNPAIAYTIGGMISGLATGDSVVLQDNLTDNLTVSANGSFTFMTSILQGRAYSVTVFTNPSSPPEYCSVASGSGTVSAGDVTSVIVTCYAGTGGCGRFSSGFTGAWSSSVAADPFGGGMGFSNYVPSGAPDTIYVVDSTSFDAYDTSTNTYTSLASPPTSLPSYGSVAWLAGALWSVSNDSIIRYDLTAGTWTTPATGLTTAFSNQTTNDDAGNLWSYSASAALLEYNITAGTTTYPPLTGFSFFSEPRITYDSCSGLLYLTDYDTTPFYSYDPVSGVQTTLTSLPGGNTFQDGVCGDRSGHIFAVTDTSTMYQYTIATDTWAAMPAGGPTGNFNSACGVGADGYLYATDPGTSSTVYRIQLD